MAGRGNTDSVNMDEVASGPLRKQSSSRHSSPSSAHSDHSSSSYLNGNGVKRIYDVQVTCDHVCNFADEVCSHCEMLPQDITEIDKLPFVRDNSPSLLSSNETKEASSDSKLPEESPFSKPIFNRPTQYLKWHIKPKTVLVMVKISDHDCRSSLVDVFMDIAKFLIDEKSLKVYVEEWLCRLVDCRDSELANKLNAMPPVDPALSQTLHIPACISELLCYEAGNTIDALADIIDLIVCLGGDGTLLHVNSLFQKLIPPVMPFYAGSLGFLMTLPTEEFRERINVALTGNVRLTLRSRFCCVIFKTEEMLKGQGDEAAVQVSMIMNHNKRIPVLPTSDQPSKWPLGAIVASYTVMNEVVVDRGQSPFLTHLDLYADNRFLTKVQADGIIIATPTGSTAYSMAAGGSMVHPSVPCIVITPICAHSLSFRPIILPANMEVRIAISEGSRSRAFVSFDGRNRRELGEGECLRVKTSAFPMPTVMASDQTDDWFHSLSHCLHWNLRSLQGNDSIPNPRIKSEKETTRK